jgi:hypothetical protein
MLVQPDYSLDLLHMALPSGEVIVREDTPSWEIARALVARGYLDAFRTEVGAPARFRLSRYGREQRDFTSYCLAKKIG